MMNAQTCTATDDRLLQALQGLSTLPAAFLVSLCSLVLYARVRLHSWPVAHLNDPRDLGVSYMICYLLTLALFSGSLITVLFLSPKRPVIRSPRSAVSWSILALVLWALLILVVKRDPGSYLEWLFD
jgi:hypothetical protein